MQTRRIVRLSAVLLAVVLTAILLTSLVVGSATQFSDVSSGSYYYDAVAWAIDRGITNGTSPTTFGPDAGCTRAQTVVFLWRAFGSPNQSVTGSLFTDVEYGSYYYTAVYWAKEKQITTGTSDSTFSPSRYCTRGEIVTFLWRAVGRIAATANHTDFHDVASNDYFYQAVLWASENRITTGKDAVTFAPYDTCTRAQIVTFLYRARDILKDVSGQPEQPTDPTIPTNPTDPTEATDPTDPTDPNQGPWIP